MHIKAAAINMLIARNQVYAQCNLVKVLSEFGFLFVGSMIWLHQYDFRKDITPLCTQFKVFNLLQTQSGRFIDNVFSF